MTFKIGSRTIGAGETFIIAEVGQAHEGSFGSALAFIDAVAEAGVDAVKFQCHIAAEESSEHEPWRVPIAGYKNRYSYWEAMEFTEQKWGQLAVGAHFAKVEFLCSPFSLKALELMNPLVPAWKVASGEIGNKPLIAAMVKTGKPVLLSTGMSTIAEIEGIYDSLPGSHPLLVFQTTSAYPVPPEEVGLNQLSDLITGTDYCGLSDHSGSPYTGLAAAALGADAIEVHVCWSKKAFGPDVSSSLDLDELKVLVEGVRWIDRIRNNPVDKDLMAEKLAPTRALFTKSAFVDSCITMAGPPYVLGEHDIAMKKPGTGLKLEQVVGRTLARTVKSGQMLSEDDFE